MQSVQDLAAAVQRVIRNVESVIVGKAEAVTFTLIAVICRGHVLIEDVPGVGKTVLTKSIARSIGCSFKRIQFTPDLLPSDITGVSIYNQKTGNFEFRPGPIMAQIVLADEVNRATPKTQSALLEAMEESQVTVDGRSYPLPEPFMVMATQNPIEYEGTFPLPEAQLDRFMMNISLGYPSPADEINILNSQQDHHPLEDLQQIMTAEELLEIQKQIRAIHVDQSIREYIVAITNATRHHGNIYLGASPRGSLALFRAAQALAAIRGRSYVIPDDVKMMVKPTLAHRIIVTPAARVRSVTSSAILDEILQTVPVPGAWVGGGKAR
ncbi:AAA family ATPase [Thermogemmatispora tikiterensis]|uniref:AAA family ATPase n=1 Tax=Thermogemmatispora tikiterensis TaxID=1825093 RepID=A0A328VF23_9CHLR|nr:MoxR family ATPase [Thermogemmatispora tikiterensis]RAQ95499.1 AAA family ATPase [Thermogemmatispora tikiterensis]